MYFLTNASHFGPWLTILFQNKSKLIKVMQFLFIYLLFYLFIFFHEVHFLFSIPVCSISRLIERLIKVANRCLLLFLTYFCIWWLFRKRMHEYRKVVFFSINLFYQFNLCKVANIAHVYIYIYICVQRERCKDDREKPSADWVTVCDQLRGCISIIMQKQQCDGPKVGVLAPQQCPREIKHSAKLNRTERELLKWPQRRSSHRAKQIQTGWRAARED